MNENKATDERGLITKYIKALKVEEVGTLGRVEIPNEGKVNRVNLLHKG